MPERRRISFATAVNKEGLVLPPSSADENMPFAVLFGKHEKGLIVAAPTNQPLPLLRVFERHQVFYIPEGFGAVAFLLDRAPEAIVDLQPNSQFDPRRSIHSESNRDFPADKVGHIICGPVPYSAVIRGAYDRHGVYIRVNVGQAETLALVI